MQDDAAPVPAIERPSLPQVFLAFLLLGATAFGGPAMIPYIGEMATERRRWMTRPTFKEGVVVAQTIPGATAMQVAAYVGLRARGLAGAAAAFVGFGLPAFILMLGLSVVYAVTHDTPISQSLFHGLQVIVVAIVARAAVTFARTTVKGWQDVVIALGAAAYLYWGGNPMLAIVAAAAAGLLVSRPPAGAGNSADEQPKPPPDPTLRPMLLIATVALAGYAALVIAQRPLLELVTLMLRIDLFAFGGGFASLPLMLHEVVEVRHWLSAPTFMDGIAMGQVTPGPIVITATFIGYQRAGFLGALCSTIAVFLPSFVLLALVVPHFDRLKAQPWFRRAMSGVLSSFVGLLVAAAVKLGLAAPWSPVAAALSVAAFVALMFRVSVPWVVLPGALLSILLLR